MDSTSAGRRRVEYVRIMPSIDEVRSAFAQHTPEIVSDPPKRRAAVAIVLSDSSSELQVLFIERASREVDPWSGHMAFPGGRVDDTDESPQAAAKRETFEEVGLSLAGCELLGQLDDSPGLQAPPSAPVLPVGWHPSFRSGFSRTMCSLWFLGQASTSADGPDAAVLVDARGILRHRTLVGRHDHRDDPVDTVRGALLVRLDVPGWVRAHRDVVEHPAQDHVPAVVNLPAQDELLRGR